MMELSALIEQRQSWRGPFSTERALAEGQLRAILQAARWAPTAHNMQNFEVIVVEDKGLLEELAAIKGTVSETFIRENYRQLSFSEEELRRKKVGILGTMFPPSWRSPDSPPSGVEDVPSQTSLVAASAALLVVLYDSSRRAPASEGDFLGIMSLGCVMQNMWLAAESLGIGFQIQSSLSSPEIQGEVKRILAIPADLTIAFTARLGFPLAPMHYLRVRREVEEFTHRDRYGNRQSG